MEIRSEAPGETGAIAALITAAFIGVPQSDGTEARIVDRLRRQGGLRLSLVAVSEGGLSGHIAFSGVKIGGQAGAWYGLGPLSVAPDRQGQGIGSALLRAGLDRLQGLNAAGVVVLGDPGFYGRFGFAVRAGLRYPNVPLEYFQALSFGAEIPEGVVSYHPAFSG
ncbi:GNAT family N-acetyltransferase [Falsigemmobacter faecalis]|uniref:N-acetyltransferase n=1 Tax=Falsigemmobacter faecalis TaxID=2488730 RepID=A0A3P3DMC5_9RHOB|nr:N-acetyltransferase [Falsigemmobacter faecalis]RRH75084.1 N-acetyltransferase [Falsigemmobacter faecalis]